MNADCDTPNGDIGDSLGPLSTSRPDVGSSECIQNLPPQVALVMSVQMTACCTNVVRTCKEKLTAEYLLPIQLFSIIVNFCHGSGLLTTEFSKLASL